MMRLVIEADYPFAGTETHAKRDTIVKGKRQTYVRGKLGRMPEYVLNSRPLDCGQINLRKTLNFHRKVIWKSESASCVIHHKPNQKGVQVA